MSDGSVTLTVTVSTAPVTSPVYRCFQAAAFCGAFTSLDLPPRCGGSRGAGGWPSTSKAGQDVTRPRATPLRTQRGGGQPTPDARSPPGPSRRMADRRQSLSPRSTICRIVMRMSLSSWPVCGCGARPQPRSSRMPAADTRAAGETASWLTMPARTLMHNSVCPRASDRNSAGNFFRAKVYGVGLPPPVGAGIEPAALGRFDGFRCAFQYRRCCVPSV